MDANILIVEDERITALNLEERLKKLGYRIAGNVGSGEAALESMRERRPDLVLMDIHLDGEMDGIRAAQLARDQYDVPVIFLTAYADAPTLERMVESTPYGYLVKPFDPRELDASIRVVLTRHRAEQVQKASDLRLQLAFDAAEMGGWEVDPVNGMVRRSGHTDQLFGLTSKHLDLPLETFLQRVLDEDRAALSDLLRACGREGTLFRTEFRCQRDDGSLVWLKAEGRLLDLPQGKRVVGVLQDVSAAKQAEVQLRQAAEVFNNTQEGFFIADAGGMIVAVNAAYGAITGYDLHEAQGHAWQILDADNLIGANLLQRLNAQGQWQGEIQTRRKSGELFPIWLSISTSKNPAGEIQNFVGVFSDMSALRDAQERLKHLAYYDALTGLPNRLLLLDRLQHAIVRADRQGDVVALLYLDLDHFKQVNDSLGHDAGDLCLQEVAQRMREAVRDEDTVARLSGDEFIVLLDMIPHSDQAAVVAAKLIATLSQPYVIKGQAHHLSVSIGIALYPQDDATPSGLLKSADIAMYDAKAQGGHRYRFYNHALSLHLSQTLMIERKLRYALAHGELVLHFQPQVNRNGQWYAAEALLRWDEPGQGLHPPLDFLPVADNAGLMPEITQWVLEHACAQMADWRARGVMLERLAINVPPQMMSDEDFPHRVAAALAKYGLPSACLEIEITEDALQTGNACISTMSALDALGIPLALDDFGTGYSSMKSLKHLPLRCLKIDRSFTEDMLDDVTDAAIVDTILTLARSLNMETVAEGVETAAQQAYLLERNCQWLQGFWIGKPLGSAAFEAQYRLLEAARRGGRMAPAPQY